MDLKLKKPDKEFTYLKILLLNQSFLQLIISFAGKINPVNPTAYLSGF